MTIGEIMFFCNEPKTNNLHVEGFFLLTKSQT